MPFEFENTELPGVIRIRPKVFSDDRGFFVETYKYSAFRQHGIPDVFLQDNHSRSTRGVLRGLHYQKPPRAQGKLVRVVHGEAFDVALDIRSGSPTFGQWLGQRLSAENHIVVYIPPGFAHGFVVLSEVAEIEYKVTSEFSREHERGIVWNDPDVSIEWPVREPILSERDRGFPRLRDIDSVFSFGPPGPASARPGRQ
jgi:dTDP-4-dehydrorhamnose 3,5-epimerase